jgi:hypothetical protein
VNCKHIAGGRFGILITIILPSFTGEMDYHDGFQPERQSNSNLNNSEKKSVGGEAAEDELHNQLME